jgi:hypothetical protein
VKLYPHKPSTAHSNRPYNPGFDGLRTDTMTVVARGDYAANAGDYSTGFNHGPPDLAAAATHSWLSGTNFTGIVFQRGEYSSAHVDDGCSNTYLFGEKYINADNYDSWDGVGDAQPLYIGYDPDGSRYTRLGDPPRQDRPGLTLDYRFGSAHAGSCHFVLCDGHVWAVNYHIEPEVHRRLGNRTDGLPVDASKF